MRRYVVTVDGRSFTLDVAELAADRFRVFVDDETFEASLVAQEDLPGAAISPEIAALPEAQPSMAPAAAAQVRPAPETSPVVERRPPAGARVDPRSDVLGAPMPGVVLEVSVVAGHAVRRGDALLVLEAMKMRNTIRAPHDGTVAEVAVEPGQPVAAGEPLVRLRADPG